MLSGCCGVPAALISSWCLLVQIVGAVWQPIKVMLQAYTVNPGVCSSGSHGGRQRLQMRMQCLEHENCRDVKSGESKLRQSYPCCCLEAFFRLERSLKHTQVLSWRQFVGGLNQPGSSVNGRVMQLVPWCNGVCVISVRLCCGQLGAAHM